MDIETFAAKLNELEPLTERSAEVTQPKLSTSLAERLNSYYRSKLFSSSQSINPLIAAASPIFAIVDKLRQVETVQNIFQLQQDLMHEIKAFEHKAQSAGYRSQVIFAARYILCAWMDEVFETLSWGQVHEWHKFALTKSLLTDTLNSQQFFLLLERCCQDPGIYIDLLELIYLCLSLGYEGEYRNQVRGNIELTAIRDNLYAIIRQQRGEFSKKLTISTETDAQVQISSPKKHWFLLGFCAAILVFLLAIFITFEHRLDAGVAEISKEVK